MIKIRQDSKIEIWCATYINTVDKREDPDKNMEIVQIEPGLTPKDYIVELRERK